MENSYLKLVIPLDLKLIRTLILTMTISIILTLTRTLTLTLRLTLTLTLFTLSRSLLHTANALCHVFHACEYQKDTKGQRHTTQRDRGIRNEGLDAYNALGLG